MGQETSALSSRSNSSNEEEVEDNAFSRIYNALTFSSPYKAKEKCSKEEKEKKKNNKINKNNNKEELNNKNNNNSSTNNNNNSVKGKNNTTTNTTEIKENEKENIIIEEKNKLDKKNKKEIEEEKNRIEDNKKRTREKLKKEKSKEVKISNSTIEEKLIASPGMFVAFNKSVFKDQYKCIKVLGKGSFGQVILCIDKYTGTERAVKIIKNNTSNEFIDKKKELYMEVDLLRKLDHPNIIKIYEFYEDEKYCYIVTELCTGGELFDEILERKRYNEIDAAIIIKQVLSGITYMHKHNVVHRDLKPENLLLESKEKNANIKIIDFGLSIYLDALKGKRDKLGTAYYIAPEILLGKECTEKCDVWSAGVILYILLSGSPPFGGRDEISILSKVKTGRYSFSSSVWTKVSSSAKNLICQMLTYKPDFRISASEALEHDWIKLMTANHAKLELPSLEASIKNIRQFHATQKLAKAALLYMGSKLTSLEETKHLTSIFSKIDKNGDGQLDRSELIEGYEELLRLKGVNPQQINKAEIEEEVDSVLKCIDFDNNGYIEYSEFITVAMDRETLLSRERLIRAFKDFDVDNSGFISTSELANLFGITEGDEDAEVLKQLIKETDQNNDGEIDFEEFRNMLMKMCGLTKLRS